MPYPSLRRDKSDWLAVCKVKARNVMDFPTDVFKKSITYAAFQEDEGLVHHIDSGKEAIEPSPLNDPNGEFTNISEVDDELSSDELEIDLESEEKDEDGHEEDNELEDLEFSDSD